MSIIDLVQKYRVAAFVRTNVSINVLKIVIDEVASGRTFFPREIKSLIEERKQNMNLDTLISLTSREKEILQLISTGYSTPAIARELQLHKDTISDHRDSLMKKFQAKNAPDLIRLAYQWRLLQ